MDDEEISIDGDQQDGEGGEEDAGGLRGAHHLADDLLVMIIMMILVIMVIRVIIDHDSWCSEVPTILQMISW